MLGPGKKGKAFTFYSDALSLAPRVGQQSSLNVPKLTYSTEQ